MTTDNLKFELLYLFFTKTKRKKRKKTTSGYEYFTGNEQFIFLRNP